MSPGCLCTPCFGLILAKQQLDESMEWLTSQRTAKRVGERRKLLMAFDAMLFCFGRCGTAPRLRGSENPRAAESRVKKEQEQKIELFSAMQCKYEKKCRAWFGEKTK